MSKAALYLQNLVPVWENDLVVSGALLQITDSYKRKLWHQLTDELRTFFRLPQLKTSNHLIEFYHNVISEFSYKLNQLQHVHLAIEASKQYSYPEAITFLESLKPKLPSSWSDSKEALILLQTQIAANKLKLNELGECKNLLEEAKTQLDALMGVDSSVYSNYYLCWAEFYKVKGMPNEFYKNGLMYLAYTPLQEISGEQTRALAFDLGITALVGDTIYNFGELLEHSVLQSLGSEELWLSEFLRAFNSGNIFAYESLVQKYAAQLENQPVLVANTELLKQKISILSLLEEVFARPPDQRVLPFQFVSQTVQRPIDQVEHLLMKAMSIGLIKGEIDEVDQRVTITWVQPRTLGFEHIQKMQSVLEHWGQTVDFASRLMETETPELFQ